MPKFLDLGLAVTFFLTCSVSAALPRCVEDERTLGEVMLTQKRNSGTPEKYSGYRIVLKDDSDSELFARLVYAETLAANCPEQNNSIVSLIIGVIANRVRKRGGDVKSVVFQLDQFSSSLNNYDESRFRDFLCPRNQKLWSKIMSEAQGLEVKNLSKDSFHYYLYKHSPRFKAPKWNFAEDLGPTSLKLQECIRVFLDPKWR